MGKGWGAGGRGKNLASDPRLGLPSQMPRSSPKPPPSTQLLTMVPTKLRAARCKASGVEVPTEMLPTRRARQGMPRRARSTRGPQFPGLSRAAPAPAAVPLTSARSRRGCAPSSAPRQRAPNFVPFSKQPSSAAQEGMARQEAERGGKVAGGARRGAGGGGARGWGAARRAGGGRRRAAPSGRRAEDELKIARAGEGREGGRGWEGDRGAGPEPRSGGAGRGGLGGGRAGLQGHLGARRASAERTRAGRGAGAWGGDGENWGCLVRLGDLEDGLRRKVPGDRRATGPVRRRRAAPASPCAPSSPGRSGARPAAQTIGNRAPESGGAGSSASLHRCGASSSGAV